MKPMLADYGDGSVPVGDWTYEIKWDGYRCEAQVKDGVVTLTSRQGNPFGFPEIKAALAGLPDCILDGELVVLDESGDSCFGSITKLSKNVTFIAFDLISDGWRQRPIEERREGVELLCSLCDPTRVKASPVFDDGEALLQVAADRGLEGIVAKRNGSFYQVGRRGRDWVKVKARLEQEFVVVGWTYQDDHPTTLGAMILAVNEGGKLVYAGKVGTGWNVEQGKELLALLKNCQSPTTMSRPVERVKAKDLGRAVWCQPELVISVAFQRWTKDDVIFHPSYQGERIDKAAYEVVRES